MSKLKLLETGTKEEQEEMFDYLLDYMHELFDTEPEVFSLTNFIFSEDQKGLKSAMKDWAKRYQKGEPLNCGTSACIIGHLPVAFPGLFGWGENRGHYSDVLARTECGSSTCGEKFIIEGRVEEDIMAMAFGGTSQQWRNVIYVDEYDRDEWVNPDVDDEFEGDVPFETVLARLDDLFEELYGEAA